MEVLEEPPLHNSAVDNVKINNVCDESEKSCVASEELNLCHKSNGIAEVGDAGLADTPVPDSEKNKTSSEEPVKDSVVDSNTEDAPPAETDIQSAPEVTVAVETVEVLAVIPENVDVQEVKDVEEALNEEKIDTEKMLSQNEPQILESSIEIDIDTGNKLVFETEVVVESNNDATEEFEERIEEHDSSNNILNELGHNIELSEALRSSDVTENVENNNCTINQEVLNSEQLLDILEGNDGDHAGDKFAASYSNKKMLETQIALQQLTRLKSKPRKPRTPELTPRRRKLDKKVEVIEVKVPSLEVKVPSSEDKVPSPEVKIPSPEVKVPSPDVKKEQSIVHALVQDWNDDDVEKEEAILEESENLLKSSDELVKEQKNVAQETSVRTSIDSVGDGQSNMNKSGDEGQPQKRLGRVIKKKVIFDPDNPDTFTKNKVAVKKESDKEQPPSKKSKSDQIVQRSKSKSPISKMQWKKPSLKPNKQNKRLTEVDKLLMDEGAVNMIYQLTPEAPKGKKNMKTKAEFIKKVQSSSTPDGKEMKFRERKSVKGEEGELRKIVGGKQRSSLSSSVKSPSVSEDFEAHSADDSIIYRRHSSSSYSSSCMSPRRLSDVEGAQSGARVSRHASDNQTQEEIEVDSPKITEIFMMESKDSEIINKDDCISLKEKLKTKLSQALSKRKRESSKLEKSPKQKKVGESVDQSIVGDDGEIYKHVKINFNQRLAEIIIRKSASRYNVEVVKEIEKAVTHIESKKDISVTLLTSECGTLCSGLELRRLLDNDTEKRLNYAYELAESIRSLLSSLQIHSKLLCSGVSGRCSGLALALVALSDLSFASERATFTLAESGVSPVTGPMAPGVAVLTNQSRISRHLINELMFLGRRLSSSEAVASGLVTRSLWPDRFQEQLRSIIGDIASQPANNVLLKKKLLQNTGSEATFQSCLENERDHLVEYWTSKEGLDSIRALY